MELPTAESFRRSAVFYRERAAREDDDWRAETLFLIAADFEAMATDMNLARAGSLARAQAALKRLRVIRE